MLSSCWLDNLKIVENILSSPPHPTKTVALKINSREFVCSANSKAESKI